MFCFAKRQSQAGVETTFVRHNGWTLPLNCLQVLTWFVLIYCGFVFFGVAALSVEPHLLLLPYVCVGLFYIIHICCLIIATSVNPADDNSKERILKVDKPFPVFDRSLHSHVIENGYCNICEVQVGKLSKHCSTCNKCVQVFDHHCAWLNNCVGKKNYRVFLMMLLSAILSAIGSLILGIYAFVQSVQSFPNRDIWWASPVPLKITFQIFIGIQSLLLLVSLCLLAHLFGFHMMLVWRGITTYEYLKQVENRKKNALKQRNFYQQKSLSKMTKRRTEPKKSETTERSSNPKHLAVSRNSFNSQTQSHLNMSHANVGQTGPNSSSTLEVNRYLQSEAPAQNLPNSIPDKPSEFQEINVKANKFTSQEPLSEIQPFPRPLPPDPLLSSESSESTGSHNVFTSLSFAQISEGLSMDPKAPKQLPPLKVKGIKELYASDA